MRRFGNEYVYVCIPYGWHMVGPKGGMLQACSCRLRVALWLTVALWAPVFALNSHTLPSQPTCSNPCLSISLEPLLSDLTARQAAQHSQPAALHRRRPHRRLPAPHHSTPQQTRAQSAALAPTASMRPRQALMTSSTPICVERFGGGGGGDERWRGMGSLAGFDRPLTRS